MVFHYEPSIFRYPYFWKHPLFLLRLQHDCLPHSLYLRGTKTVRCERRTKRSKRSKHITAFNFRSFKQKSTQKKTHKRNKGKKPYKETMPRKAANVETLTISSKAAIWTMRLAALDTGRHDPQKKKRMDRKHKTTINKYVKMTKSVVILVYFSNS